MSAPALALGALLGWCLAWLHARLLWRAVRGALAGQASWPLLLGAPARATLVAGGFYGAAALGGGPGLAGAIGGWWLGRRRAQRDALAGEGL